MTPKDPEPFDLRTELTRIQLAAQYCQTPAELKEAVESLAFAVLALMDSFGIQTVRVRPATLLPPGGGDQRGAYIFEQHDHHDKIVKTATLHQTKIEPVT